MCGGEASVNLGCVATNGADAPVEATASIAKPRSLFIKAVAKPGLKSLFAGDVGTGPGTGQLVCTAQQFPVAPVITSKSESADSPSFSAGTNARPRRSAVPPAACCCKASRPGRHPIRRSE